MTIVADASAVVEFLFRTERAPGLDLIFTDPEIDLHVPALCDVEVVSALRRTLRQRLLSLDRAKEALEDYLDLPLTRHGHQALLPRCLGLRDVFSAYDAAYVALAEGLSAPLLTADRRLARGAEGMGIVCLPA